MGSDKTALSTSSDEKLNHVSQILDKTEESPNWPTRWAPQPTMASPTPNGVEIPTTTTHSCMMDVSNDMKAILDEGNDMTWNRQESYLKLTAQIDLNLFHSWDPESYEAD